MRNLKILKRHPTFSKLLRITSRSQDKLTPNEILESVTFKYLYTYILVAKVLRTMTLRLFLLFQFLVNALRMFFQRRSLNESENHLKNPEPLPLLNPFSMTLPNRMMPTGNFKLNFFDMTKKNFFDKLMYMYI